MSSNGRNEGCRVLDDFVCEAIHGANVPQADERHRGRNEDMLILAELSFDASATRSEEVKSTDENSLPRPAIIDDQIKLAVERVAAIIFKSVDPVAATAMFQQLLLAKLDRIQK